MFYETVYKTVCQGDSGSPMVFKQKGAVDELYVVEGIVSFYLAGTIPCAERKPGMLSMFTAVYEYVTNNSFYIFKYLFLIIFCIPGTVNGSI